jgi:biotin carboxyl carrier protein
VRKFRVQVNGNMYEVEVEEIGGVPTIPQPAPVALATSPTPPAPPAVPVPAPKAAPVAPSGNGSGVAAPMPGTITDIRVKVGDRVEPRTVVMMLEAMKMENEIFAGRTGVVSQIAVDKGASVNTGDLLMSVDPA